MKKIKKCVIPAAGMGTRFLPATKALPKEMFPIIDKPVMQYLVEDAIAAGCEDIIIITGRSKRAIEDHFDSNFELEERLDKGGKFDYLKLVKGLNTLANIIYVRQPYPLGDGDALLRIKNLVGNEPFLVLNGDELIYNDDGVGASQQLVAAYEKADVPVIGTYAAKESEVSSYGILESNDSYDSLFKIEKFLEKPNPTDTDSRQSSVGKYLLTPSIFDYIEKLKQKKQDGEIRVADAFELMRQESFIYGMNIKGERYDTGNKIGFLKATIAYGLKHPETKDELLSFLKELSL